MKDLKSGMKDVPGKKVRTSNTGDNLTCCSTTHCGDSYNQKINKKENTI